MKEQLIIAFDNCDGLEEEFADFVEARYPEIDVHVEHIFNSMYLDCFGEQSDIDPYGNRFWEEFLYARV